MNRFKLTAGLAAVATLALPAVASAHAKSSTSSVRAHVRNADQALTMVSTLVRGHDGAATAIEMVVNRRQTQAATREAARLRGRAKATALRLVASQRNANAETYAALVDEAIGGVQVDMASAITSNLYGRETALSTLTGLVASLPAQAQPGIAKAIAALSSGGQDEVTNILAAKGSGQISAVAQPYLDTALSVATSAMNTGLARLQDLVSMLPAVAQGPVQSAIDRVSGILQAIFGDVTTAGQTPVGGAIASSLPIPSNLPIPSGLPIPGFVPIGR